jgi:hypothetical protein
LEKKTEQVLPGSEEFEGRGEGGDEGINGPNSVCTYEKMNKGKKILKK